MKSKSKERENGTTDTINPFSVSSNVEDNETEYLKTIKLRMSRPTIMTVGTEEINRINIQNPKGLIIMHKNPTVMRRESLRQTAELYKKGTKVM